MGAADLGHVPVLRVLDVSFLNVLAPLRDVNVEILAGRTELCEDALGVEGTNRATRRTIACRMRGDCTRRGDREEEGQEAWDLNLVA